MKSLYKLPFYFSTLCFTVNLMVADCKKKLLKAHHRIQVHDGQGRYSKSFSLRKTNFLRISDMKYSIRNNLPRKKYFSRERIKIPHLILSETVAVNKAICKQKAPNSLLSRGTSYEENLSIII